MVLIQQQQQMQAQQQLIIQLTQREQSAATAPAATVARNLAEQMVAFTYDPDKNLTFESWYKRYQTIFTTEVGN